MKMRFVLLLTLAVLGSSGAWNVHIDKENLNKAIHTTGRESGRILEGIILEILEQIRELMRNGSDNFPVLDPFNLGSLRVDEDLLGIPDILLELNDMKVTNLSDFVIDTMNFNVEGIIFQRYIINFDVYLPEINVDTSNYKLALRILGADIYGDGDMSLKITEPRVKGTIEASLTAGQGIFLTLNKCDIAVSLKAFEPVITGFWGSETSSAFVNSFLKTLIPELMDFFENEINGFISTTVHTIANEILKNFDLVDIIRP